MNSADSSSSSSEDTLSPITETLPRKESDIGNNTFYENMFEAANNNIYAGSNRSSMMTSVFRKEVEEDSSAEEILQ